MELPKNYNVQNEPFRNYSDFRYSDFFRVSAFGRRISP
jgi:hypothetical protein